MLPYITEPSFLEGNSGKLFTIRYRPRQKSLGTVILVPPFGEEMNKCRPMMTRQARQTATLGFTSVVFDLFGTGDSEGVFGQASWRAWSDDLQAVVRTTNPGPNNPLWLIGVRLGALLALDTQCNHDVSVSGVICWNAVINGRIYMNQFLRLRLASELSTTKEERQTVEGLRKLIAESRAIDIAGYELNAELLRSIDDLKIQDLLRPSTTVWMLESNDSQPPNISPAVRRLSEEVIAEGSDLALMAVTGPPFWATQEIALSCDLIESTSEIIAGMSL